MSGSCDCPLLARMAFVKDAFAPSSWALTACSLTSDKRHKEHSSYHLRVRTSRGIFVVGVEIQDDGCGVDTFSLRKDSQAMEGMCDPCKVRPFGLLATQRLECTSCLGSIT